MNIETKLVAEEYDHGNAKRLIMKITVDGIECQGSLIMAGPSDWVDAFMAGEFPLNEATKDYRFSRRPAYKSEFLLQAKR